MHAFAFTVIVIILGFFSAVSLLHEKSLTKFPLNFSKFLSFLSCKVYVMGKYCPETAKIMFFILTMERQMLHLSCNIYHQFYQFLTENEGVLFDI